MWQDERRKDNSRSCWLFPVLARQNIRNEMLNGKNGRKTSQISSFNLSQYVNSVTAKRVLLISNRDISVRPFLYGEDYYISTLVSRLTKVGIPIDFVLADESKAKAKSKTRNEIEKTVDNSTLIILHNVSPFLVWKIKIKKKPKVIMPVYYISNKVSPVSEKIRILGLLFWQPVVDEYLVPSSVLAHSIKRLGVSKRISVLPPTYSCPYCNSTDNLKKRQQTERYLPGIVNVVYIGEIIPKRINLEKIVNKLGCDRERKYRLTIYTISHIKPLIDHPSNVKIEVVEGKLSEKGKCDILRASHVFIAPAKDTTMEPSISVIEAEYHGNVVVGF